MDLTSLRLSKHLRRVLMLRRKRCGLDEYPRGSHRVSFCVVVAICNATGLRTLPAITQCRPALSSGAQKTI